MTPTPIQSANPTNPSDVLSCLPVSTTVNYRKGEVIYGSRQRSSSIYLIVQGKVKLSHVPETSGEVLLDILLPDEVFGESAFLSHSTCGEQAMALERVTLMRWPISTVEELVARRPGLAVSLLQISAQRSADFARRVQNLACNTIQERLALALTHFAQRFGTPEEDGSLRMMPLTHELLSQHVGTSREVITMYMNRFRERGYVRYSRKETVLCNGGFNAGVARPAG